MATPRLTPQLTPQGEGNGTIIVGMHPLPCNAACCRTQTSDWVKRYVPTRQKMEERPTRAHWGPACPGPPWAFHWRITAPGHCRCRLWFRNSSQTQLETPLAGALVLRGGRWVALAAAPGLGVAGDPGDPEVAMGVVVALGATCNGRMQLRRGWMCVWGECIGEGPVKARGGGLDQVAAQKPARGRGRMGAVNGAHVRWIDGTRTRHGRGRRRKTQQARPLGR